MTISINANEEKRTRCFPNHKARWFPVIGFLLILMGFSIPFLVAAEDITAEHEIHDRLAEVAPEAVDDFIMATLALIDEDYLTARELFEKVLNRAPDFTPALRRMSYVEPDTQKALDLARRAFELEDHPANTEALIDALIELDTPESLSEASSYGHLLLKEAPEHVDALITVCRAALKAEDFTLLKNALSIMKRIVPDEMATHYFAGIDAAINERWVEAEREIRIAENLGLPPEVADRLLQNSGIASKARMHRSIVYAGYGAAAWFAGLVLLLPVGIILSRLTLSAIARQGGDIQVDGGPMRLMRRIYSAVIGLTSVYFYISIPVVLIIVIAAGGGLIYSFFAIGQVPIKLVAIIGGLVLVTVYAMLKSLFIRVSDEDPGPRLSESEAPSFFAVLRDVASRVGAPMVDTVFIVPDATAAVFERGGFSKRLRGQTEKCLILGLGALNGLTQLQLKSILAHEFGHISNRDTAGGSMALHVRRSIHASAEAMVKGKADDWYNPAWLFINAFYSIFLRVSQGASRLQEVMADRWAVMSYGAHAFVNGLKHVIWRSIEYDMISRVEIHQAISRNRRLNNLYTLEMPETWPQTEREEESGEEQDASEEKAESPQAIAEDAFQQAMNAQTSAYDSHPATHQRISWVEHVKADTDMEDDGRPAWDLLENGAELQTRMTALINENVQEYIRHQQIAEG